MINDGQRDQSVLMKVLNKKFELLEQGFLLYGLSKSLCGWAQNGKSTTIEMTFLTDNEGKWKQTVYENVFINLNGSNVPRGKLVLTLVKLHLKFYQYYFHFLQICN